MARFLVTGGAGYVGSHLVRALVARGDEVVVLDSLRQGHRGAIPAGVELVHAELADRRRVAEVFAAWKFEAVFHFAALSLVGESMREPLRYCVENTANSLSLADAAVQAGVRKFVFSSTAALFGMPKVVPIAEDADLAPASAYGESKLMVEKGLFWADQVHGLRSACLRYTLGNGAGYSVKQVIDSVERIGGRPVPHSFGPRRAGDPAVLVAASDALRRETGWQPRFPALDDIVRTAWAWHEAHPRGYDDR